MTALGSRLLYKEMFWDIIGFQDEQNINQRERMIEMKDLEEMGLLKQVLWSFIGDLSLRETLHRSNNIIEYMAWFSYIQSVC